MMNEHDAMEILKSAEQLNIEVWLDGGWGVDALLGQQTRSHNDIDIFIPGTFLFACVAIFCNFC